MHTVATTELGKWYPILCTCWERSCTCWWGVV